MSGAGSARTRFLHALNFCMLLPGPEAMQLATYVGWRLHGTLGGLAAGFCSCCRAPVVLGLHRLCALFGHVPLVEAAFVGIKAAVLVIVIEALLSLGLAETTPGPLILVTEFVGFLAGYRKGGEPKLAFGLLGAAITLWATFAPCFLWIFVGRALYRASSAEAPVLPARSRRHRRGGRRDPQSEPVVRASRVLRQGRAVGMDRCGFGSPSARRSISRP